MQTVKRLVFVYNAEMSVLGGLRYAAERIKTGEDPCALCEITYSGVMERAEWKQCRTHYSVSIDGVYKNELDAPMSAAAAGSYPCVLAQLDAGYLRVLSADEIASCRAAGDAVLCLETALRAGLARLDLGV